jgi:2,3-bisphosphoglycerate-dependent phosphoglycerate mutase
VKTTVYLIRHAQSHPRSDEHYSQWTLSKIGKEQASALAPLLRNLGIEKLYSSPYARCVETIKPFVDLTGLDLLLHQDFEERVVAKVLLPNFDEICMRSWDDFDFALPDCESSSAAQARFCGAVQRIFEQDQGATVAICSHGNVIALLLNHLDKSYSRQDSEKIRNPDVIKIVATEGRFLWDREFFLPGLEDIATHQIATPIDFAPRTASSM